MKKPIFGCGWKMYLSDNEAIQHAEALKARVGKEDQVELYVLPSFTAIRDVKKILDDTDINVGATKGLRCLRSKSSKPSLPRKPRRY